MEKIAGIVTKEVKTGTNGHSTNGKSPNASQKVEPVRIAPSKVHETLARHMLADGFDLVIDLKNSQATGFLGVESGVWA